MENSSLIVFLILQDLHNQLILLLEKAGLDINLHYLDLMKAVSELMGIPAKNISDHWSGIYSSFMDRAPTVEITPTGQSLQDLAEECYYLLWNCGQVEKLMAEKATHKNE